MKFDEAYSYVARSQRRIETLMALRKPFTAQELSFQTSFNRKACSYILYELSVYQLVRCLNDAAQRSRVFWLTAWGAICQERLFRERKKAPPGYRLPDVDWNTYGWMLFSHRRAVVEALDEPRQPAAIKRRIRVLDRGARISASNVRDVVKLLREKGLVESVWMGRKAHPRYQLTQQGRALRGALL